MILYNTKKKSTKSCTNVFLGQSSKAIEIETKINTQALIKVTSFCTAKETIKKKKKTTDWENIFANDETNRELISKIHKQLIEQQKSKQLN